jgi:hypothetical protein
MIEPLRPMSAGQLMDRTFSLYRKNFLLFVGIASVGPAAGVIFQLITLGSRVVPVANGHAARPLTRFGLTYFIGWSILLAGMAVAHGGTVKAVAAVYLDQKISIAGAYRALRGRIGRVLGIFFLTTLISGLVAGLAAVALALVLVIGSLSSRSGAVGFWLGAAIGVGVVAAFLAMYVRYALAIQACVVEDLAVRDSLARSVQLSEGSRWRTAAIYVVFLILSWIAAYGLSYVARRTGILLHNRTATVTLIYLAGFISGSITGPLATIGISLLYYDERVRKEAFDLQLMVLNLDAPAGAAVIPLHV